MASRLSRKGLANFLVYFCVFVEGEGLWYCLLPYARCVWGGGQSAVQERTGCQGLPRRTDWEDEDPGPGGLGGGQDSGDCCYSQLRHGCG